MPHVADDGSPLHERLIYLKYGDTYLPALCDASGNIVAVLGAGQVIEVTQADAADLKATVTILAGSTIAVTQATAASLKALIDLNDNQNVQARTYGLWGANQKPAGLPFGASAVVAVAASNTSLPLGDSTLALFTVPANTVYVITHMLMYHTGTPPTIIRMIATVGGTAVRIMAQLTPPTNVNYDRQGWWVLGPNDTLDVRVTGAAQNDDLFGQAVGFELQRCVSECDRSVPCLLTFPTGAASTTTGSFSPCSTRQSWRPGSGR